MTSNKKGSVLVLTTMLAFFFVMIVAAYMDNILSSTKLTESSEIDTEALYSANAGIEQVKYLVKSSTYSVSGNDWLIANSSPEGNLALSYFQISENYKVNVTVYDNGNDTYTAVSDAYYAPSISDSPVFKGKVAIDIRGRDLFSKYMFFTHLDDINMGTSTVNGSVHSNRAVNFYYGGAKMYGDVTSVRGINFTAGATEDNTKLFGAVNGSADTIPWPNTSEIATLHDEAVGVYQVSNSSATYSGLGNFNTEIEFINNTVKITAKDPGSGAVLKTGTYPIPANNLIFVQGAITSLKGDINGRVTIATMDKVDVTGNIRYVDSEGDRAYALMDADGQVIDNTPDGVVWSEENGYYYKANPAYNPASPSVVGIMALKDVTITNAAPYNTEMHAAVFSSQGNWHCDLAQKKGNLRVLGSMTQKLRGWRYNVSGYGWAQSGEYCYDENLLSDPPPFYLQVDAPLFGGWRKLW